MPDSIRNSLLVIAVLLLAKSLLSWAIQRQIWAGIDPRVVQAGREYGRLRKKDPAAADRYARELAEELRDQQREEDALASGGRDSSGEVPSSERSSHKAMVSPTLAFAGLLVDLLILGYLAFRIPAATVPALLAIAVAAFRVRTSPFYSLDDPDFLVRQPDDVSLWRLKLPHSRALLWGMTGGAIGYAALAGLGIGVPAPEAPLEWRIVGGLVFGAATGVFVSLILSTVPPSYRQWRLQSGV